MKPIYLYQKLETDSVIKGKISGVSYSGGIIKNYRGWENFIVDLDTTTVVKQQTPILRDHLISQVAGHGSASIEGSTIRVDGIISKNTPFGVEILGLAEDGFEWEQSIGIFDGRVEEVRDTVVNGHRVDHGWVLRDGLLREISIVALGADMMTYATILSQQKGEQQMLTKEQWIKFACACGGDKDDTPEQLEEKMKGAKLESEEDKAKIEALESEIESLKEEIAKKTAEIDAIKEAEEADKREEDISMAVKAKGIKMTAEKIKDAASSKEKTEMLLSVIEGMEAVKPGKIDPKLTNRETVGTGGEVKTADEIRLAAKQMVADGKAPNFIEAIAKLEVK